MNALNFQIYIGVNKFERIYKSEIRHLTQHYLFVFVNL